MRTFYGWRVVGAAFVLAAFGWGIGFYGPPVFLRVICESRGWALATVSAAVTAHFLVGAAVGAATEGAVLALGAVLVVADPQAVASRDNTTNPSSGVRTLAQRVRGMLVLLLCTATRLREPRQA